MSSDKVIERFAPSPTGLLHLGHAYSAKVGYDAAMVVGGDWLLRIEDIDFTRARPEFYDAIERDLAWLGFSWPTPVMVQSKRSDAYDAALEKLCDLGVVYGCACQRRDIALSAPHDWDGRYIGTCRDKGLTKGDLCWRINMERASALIDSAVYREIGQARDKCVGFDVNTLDDVVLARRDIGVSYHLAVVVDDAHQSITHVTRGADLENQTPIHVVLQKLLDLPTPIYRHHSLVRDESGKRLAKRDDARAIAHYRDQGLTPTEVWTFVAKNRSNLGNIPTI